MSSNLVDHILNHPFGSMTYEDKKNTIEQGPPKPNLKWEAKYGNTTRRFNSGFYAKRPWLTAPAEGEPRLLCWPCLLFQPSGTADRWKNNGYKDLKNYASRMRTHETSSSHLESVLKLHHFGQINDSINEAASASRVAHNDRVSHNREVMKRLVSVVVLLAKQGLSFRGHDESSGSTNRGNYIEFLEALRTYDETLHDHLANEQSQFKGLSKDIQNDLIECVDAVLVDAIDAELDAASFFAVGADETTDISTDQQLSMTVRYVDSEGEIQERFQGLWKLPGRCDAETVAERVKNMCKKYAGSEDKLVSQSYDGASVMSGRENGVRAKVQDEFKYAAFLHCYAHQLNLVLMDGANVPEVRRFFCGVRAFHTFFHRSPKRTALLSSCGSHSRMCAGSETRWQYRERAVHAILKNMEAIVKCLTIITTGDEWTRDDGSVAAARGLLGYLKDKRFLFLLTVYDDVFARTGVLYKKLQSRHLDARSAVTSVQDVISQVAEMRCQTSFASKLESAGELDLGSGDSSRVGRTSGRQSVRKEFSDSVLVGQVSYEPDASGEGELRRLYFQILDQVSGSLTARFKDHGVLEVAELVDPARFQQLRADEAVSRHALQTVHKYYPGLFDEGALWNELRAIWGFKDMRLEPQSLLKYMLKQGLADAFPQVCRLLKLVLTIKPTTVAEERSFSTLRRIKSYLRSTMCQDRLSSLTRINIETKLVMGLSRSGRLSDLVIGKFAAMKGRKIDLLYR